MATALLHLLACAITLAAPFDPTWASLDTRENPKWYDEAKVGIFIVGGVFSVPSWGDPAAGGASGEWFQHILQTDKRPSYVAFMKDNYPPGFTYADFAADLTYELFNATQWAELFVKSGAKYTA